MKRGAVHNTAKEIGCNKVAFAHHRDDVIETLLLSLFYEGRIHTFSPVTYLDRTGITLIRPVHIHRGENDTFLHKQKGNQTHSQAAAGRTEKKTKRRYIKDLTASLMEENKHLKDNLFGAIQRSGINGWHPPR